MTNFMDKPQLNLGCGALLWEGFINFDKGMYKRNGLRTDVIGDINKLPFNKETFRRIVCVHTIEHLYKTDAINMLHGCYDLLVNSGILIVEGPDIVGCYNRYVERQDNPSRFIDFIYGGESNRLKYGDEYSHKSGWTGKLLAKEFEEIGFVNVMIKIGQYHGMGRRDFRVEGSK